MPDTAKVEIPGLMVVSNVPGQDYLSHSIPTLCPLASLDEESLMIEFSCTKTQEPDFTGSNFYVAYGREFDEVSYERASGVKPPREMCRHIQKAVDDLQHGEWLQISHGEST